MYVCKTERWKTTVIGTHVKEECIIVAVKANSGSNESSTTHVTGITYTKLS